MHVVYTGEAAPNTVAKSIFLAGPSPRKDTDLNWRPEAIQILKELGYDGVVYAPIWRDADKHPVFQYDSQVEWETKYLNQADVIVFWVPRDMKTAPAMTTNVEYGMWFRSGKVVLGYPQNAESMRYMDWWGRKEGVPIEKTLKNTLLMAVERLKDGAARTGGERDVPLHLWIKPEFQSWYAAQKAVGNRLDGAEVVWSFRVGKNKERVFLWALHCNVWIASEDRNKTNEVVVFRPDISAIVAFKRPDRATFQFDKTRPLGFMHDTEVVLVREFRSPARNPVAKVDEVPGGSSWKPGTDPLVTASDELGEETGLAISADRFVPIGNRQIASTLAAHHAHAYAVELTAEEMLSLKWDANTPKGNHDDTEYTYVQVTTVGEILDGDTVDWANVGMILHAVLH